MVCVALKGNAALCRGWSLDWTDSRRPSPSSSSFYLFVGLFLYNTLGLYAYVDIMYKKNVHGEGRKEGRKRFFFDEVVLVKSSLCHVWCLREFCVERSRAAWGRGVEWRNFYRVRWESDDKKMGQVQLGLLVYLFITIMTLELCSLDL